MSGGLRELLLAAVAGAEGVDDVGKTSRARGLQLVVLHLAGLTILAAGLTVKGEGGSEWTGESAGLAGLSNDLAFGDFSV